MSQPTNRHVTDVVTPRYLRQGLASFPSRHRLVLLMLGELWLPSELAAPSLGVYSPFRCSAEDQMAPKLSQPTRTVSINRPWASAQGQRVT
jgi:hypothetical protein